MPAKEFFDTLASRADPERIAGINHAYLFDIQGEGRWLVELRDGTVTVTENPTTEGDVQFSTTGETFDRLADGRQNPMMAYMTGKLKVNGDLGAAMELKNLF